MVILLDENCPVALYHRLKTAGMAVEHIIVLGQRGLPDRDIRDRLVREAIVFLTQDNEFSTARVGPGSTVILSRIRQGRPIAERVQIWFTALAAFMARPPVGQIFELTSSGEIRPRQASGED